MIGKQIKKLLTAHGMSQTELASLMHTSESRLSKIVNGSLEPGITDLKLLSEIFKISIDELIKGETVEQMSLIEKAIKDSEENFKELLEKDKEWQTRKDDKGNNLIFYIMKYQAYDYLSIFYQPKKHVPSNIQTLYGQTILTLIKKKRYDEYLRLINYKFTWDLSVLDIDKNEMLLNNQSSDQIVYLIIDKSSEQLIKEYKLQKFDASFINNQYRIYHIDKDTFINLCDNYLMEQYTDPKYIINAHKREAYLKTYLAHHKHLLNQNIQEIFEKDILNDSDAIYEALFINKEPQKIIEIFYFRLSKYNASQYYIDKYVNYASPEKIREMTAYGFTNFVNRIKAILSLTIKYDDLETFKKMLLYPNFKAFLDKAREQYKKDSEYGMITVNPKFFDFDMPFEWKKVVIELFGNELYEIKFDFKEAILKESKDEFEFILRHGDVMKFYKLWYSGEGDIERKLNRALTIEDLTKLYKALLEVIQDVNKLYLESGNLNSDEVYKKFVHKAQKNELLKYYLVKIWVNLGNYEITDDAYQVIQDQGIQALEAIKSIKEEAIKIIINEHTSPIDVMLKDMYQLLPEIKNLKFLKYLLDMLNPFILGKQIKEKNVTFGDINTIKLIIEYTNEISNSDLVLLTRNK